MTGARPQPVVAAGTATALQELLADLVVQAREVLGTDTATVLLLDKTGSFLDTIAASGLERTVAQRARVMVGRGFAGSVAAQRQPVIIQQVGPDNVVNPLLYRQGVHSLLGVPLLDGPQLLGVLHVGTFTERRFDDRDVHALSGVAARVGHALQQHVDQAQLTAAVLLQESLLPGALPDLHGLTIAGRYIPAEGHLGGDWYDVFTLPGERVGLVIGDVAGHGLPAATIMGRLRSALRAYALEHDDPATVLTRLDAKITHFESGVFATVLYAVTAFPYDTITFSSAGHLPPLHRTGAGPATFVDVATDLPLGLALDDERHQATISFPVGSSLVMFSDGLVERRPPASTRSYLDELANTIGTGEPEDECANAVEAMFHSSRPQDDATMLVLKRTGTSE